MRSDQIGSSWFWLFIASAFIVVALVLVGCINRSGTSEIAVDSRATHKLTHGNAPVVSFQETFDVEHIELVCVLDEYTAPQSNLTYLRTQGRIDDVQYESEVRRIPEGMIGFMLIMRNHAELRLISRWDVRVNFPNSRCFDGSESFARDADGAWTITGDSFPA